jgi:hypothetical protein
MNWIKRRQLLTFPLWLTLGGGACAALPNAAGQPSFTVSPELLQQAVTKRFPLRYPVGGLLDLNLQAPRLRLLPETNRLGTEMVVLAAGPLLGRSYTGEFDLDFALRYEASDQSIRAHQLHVNSFRFPDLPSGTAELLNAYGPALAEQSLQELVLHKLRPQDLALPDAMGLQPGSLTVTAKGLVISFVNKPLR